MLLAAGKTPKCLENQAILSSTLMIFGFYCGLTRTTSFVVRAGSTGLCDAGAHQVYHQPQNHCLSDVFVS